MTSPSGPCRLAPVGPRSRDCLLLGWGEMPDWRTAVELDVQPRRLEPPAPDVQLSARQQQILEFITGYIDAHGYSPSFREIASAVGLKSMSTVAYQVGELRRLGVLAGADEYARPRSLRLLPGGAA